MTHRIVCRWDDATPVEVLPGLIRRTLGTTDDLMLTEFRSEAGVELPLHHHPHTQIGYLISGELALTIDGERTVFGPGDSWAIPGDVPHSAKFLADSVIIEAFAPMREDYVDEKFRGE
jgi:quercetin dioxygenase-like cupin family protein